MIPESQSPTSTSGFQMVAEFMTAFNQEIPEEVRMPRLNIRELRDKMTDEEFLETEYAPDPIHILDGVCDLIYVAMGTALATGFTEQEVNEAFREVHRSNMSKFWRTEHLDSIGLNWTAKKSGVAGLWIVTNEDGKVVKPTSYSPADLAGVLKKLKEGVA